MRYVYVALCLVALAATFRFTSELSRALLIQKGPTTEAFTRLDTESHPADQVAVASRMAQPENADLIEQPSSPDRPDVPASSTATDVPFPPVDEPAAAGVLPSSIEKTAPVRHRAALHDTMVTPGNFEYLGAFRPPHIEQNGTTFAYGGWGIAWRADGDPGGPDDGYPGSLFLLGHQHHQKVAEISIPAPVNSKLKRAVDLPVADILQPFEDITDGLLEEMTAGSSEHFHIGGMLVTNGLLHWTMHKYYNVENIDYPSHGTSGLDLQASIAHGPWHLGPMNSGRPEWHSYKHAGYIFEIPPAESAQWFGGRNLISGLQISTGLQSSSQGPAMFAYSLPPEETAPNRSLNAIPLAWYSQSQPLERHHPADRWTGGAWLTLGNKQAVVIVGRKSLGEFYYGEARPQDCTQDKGYHGPPYEVELLFYSPASLIHAANGALPAIGLNPWLRWVGVSDGGGLNQYMFDTCGKQVGGLAYDRDRNLLYLVQIDAGTTSDHPYEALPVIHVFRIVD